MLPAVTEFLQTRLEGYLRTRGFTADHKPTLEEAKDSIYTTIFNIVDQYGPQPTIEAMLQLAPSMNDFMHRQITKLGKDLRLVNLGTVIYDFYRDHAFTHPNTNGRTNGKGRRVSSTIIYTTETGLEQFIEQHTTIEKQDGVLVVVWNDEQQALVTA